MGHLPDDEPVHSMGWPLVLVEAVPEPHLGFLQSEMRFRCPHSARRLPVIVHQERIPSV